MIAKSLYGRDTAHLTAEEKQLVSTLGTLAAGLAGGVAGGDTSSAEAGAGAGRNAVENNNLSLPKGLMDYGAAATSWNQYAEANGLTAEQKQAGLDKLAKGDMPDGINITKVIVNGSVDGALITGAWYIGPAATAGKVLGGAIIAEVANGTYQWFDLRQPGNESKGWDYKGSISAGVTGALAPGHGIWQNVGIAAGGAVFSDGPDVGAIGIAAGGALAGGKFGEYAPGFVNSVTGKDVPGFVFDAVSSLGTEFLGGYTKNLLNPPPSKNDSEKEKEGKK